MKVLLVYPNYPETFWSFKHALKIIGKKSSLPPLGLLTVASLLPESWEKRLVDMNVGNLHDDDVEWADCVFISAMVVQRESVKEIVKKCKNFNKKIVAGGPLFSSEYEDFKDIDHFVLGEAEITLPLFLQDLEGGSPKRVYSNSGRADLTGTPPPSWDLVDIRKYISTNIQYSRGCPFNCEFCDITYLFGRVQRTKSRDQVLAELDDLYNRDWRGGVFFVDDNFIGNKEKLKREILPSIIEWRRGKKYPFTFTTEASLNLSDDQELMDLMAQAGFGTVFLGIETPDEDSLAECGKYQNKNRDLVSCIKKIQRSGMEVQGGFIIGFDNDKPTIFERQIKFIQESGVVTAMVGILGVIKGTRLYQRLKEEKRLLGNSSGDNTDGSINFMTKMENRILIEGYKKIVGTIYSPRYFYQRIINLLKEHRSAVQRRASFRSKVNDLRIFLRTIWFLGIKEKIKGFYFWKLIFWTLAKKPKSLPLAISLAIQGYHFRKVFNRYF